jgi:hypothetical protein
MNIALALAAVAGRYALVSCIGSDMKLNRTFIAWLFSALIVALPTFAKDWRGIVPLASTRADVERSLGRPMERSLPDISFFDLKDESVRVVYSEGRCKPGIAGEWDVPEDIVLRIEVTPKKEVLLKDVQADMSKYRKVVDPHITGHLIYVSEEEGVSIDTSSIDPECERVLSIRYRPKSTEENLRCKSPES